MYWKDSLNNFKRLKIYRISFDLFWLSNPKLSKENTKGEKKREARLMGRPSISLRHANDLIGRSSSSSRTWTGVRDLHDQFFPSFSRTFKTWKWIAIKTKITPQSIKAPFRKLIFQLIVIITRIYTVNRMPPVGIHFSISLLTP